MPNGVQFQVFHVSNGSPAQDTPITKFEQAFTLLKKLMLQQRDREFVLGKRYPKLELSWTPILFSKDLM